MNAIFRPFQLKITNHGEIRMGSPYNLCDIELIGFDKLKLPKHGWQDKYVWSDDNERLVLIRLDLENNEPGFHFFIIDTSSGEVTESERIFGFVNELAINGNKIRYNKFLYDKEKSKPGQRCCNFDEEFKFT